MKLNQRQIARLNEFTQKHYVEWYDVQAELVDHLANGIEAQWEENPNLDFEEALDKEFKKFGVFGFMDVVAQTERAMSKRYWRFLFSEVKKWFKLPQILAVLSLFLGFLFILKSPYPKQLILGLTILLLIWICYRTIVLKRKLKRRKTSKKWLLEQIIFQQASGMVLIIFINVLNTFNLIDVNQMSGLVLVIISILFSLTVIISIISLHVLPSKANQLLKETYPTFVTN